MQMNTDTPPTSGSAAPIECGGCGMLGYPEDHYCACCGEALQNECPNCGAPVLHPISVYCTNCGVRLPDPKTSSAR